MKYDVAYIVATDKPMLELLQVDEVLNPRVRLLTVKQVPCLPPYIVFTVEQVFKKTTICLFDGSSQINKHEYSPYDILHVCHTSS